MLRPLAWLAGLIVVLLVALQVLLHSLDRPWLKRRIVELARTSGGVDVDYRTARIDLLSGAVIEDLVVQSPQEVRPFAPELVRVGQVEVAWAAGSILRGRAPMVESVSVSDVALTVVVDENGRTSFDALAPPGPAPPPTPKTPLSGQTAKLLATAPPVGRVDVQRVAVLLVRTDHGAVVEHTELHGLGLALTTGATPSGTGSGWRIDAKLGAPDAPLALELTRAPQGETAASARAKLWATVGVSSDAVTAALDLRMVDQTFAATVSADHWLHADAGLRFDRAAGRTEITLDHLEAGDGALTADASVDLPDEGDPLVHHAHADADVARLLRWLPPGFAPVTAERAHVRCQVDALVVSQVPALSRDGAVAVDAELSNVAVSALASPLAIDSGTIALHAQPAEGGGVAARGSVKLSALRLASPASPVDARDVGVELDGQRGADEVVTGKLGVRFSRIELGGTSPVVAGDGHVELRVGGLHPNPKDPLATRGDVAVSMDAGSIDARASGMHVTVDGLALRAHTVLDGHAPYNLELEAPVSRLRLVGGDGKMLTDGPARIEVRARDVQPDLDHPVATRGVFEAKADLGKTQASLDATKARNAVDYKLRVTVPTLRVIRPFLPPALLERAGWDRMTFEVHSSGHVEPLGGAGLAIRHTTDVKLDHFSFGSVAAQAVVLKMQSHGTALKHEADIDLRSPGLTIGGGPASNDHVTLSATVDRERPSLRFKLATDGRVATQLAGSLSFDPSRKALVYEADAHLAGLGPLAAFASTVHGLDAVDLSQLELTLSARGALLGVVAGIGRDGTLTLEPSPTRTAAVEGDADLKLAHLRWAQGDTVVTTPALVWHGTMHAGPRRTLDSRLELAALHVAHGSHTIDVNGIEDEATASASGDLANPELELTQQLSVSAIEQDLVPGYPLGDLVLALSLEQSREGVVHITQAKVTNGLGGTTLALSGTVDTLEGHRYLALSTSLTQDLARLSTVPARFTGRGKVAVEAKVTSPDLAFYTVRAVVKGQDVNLTLPAQGVEMDAASGEVPVTVTVDVSNPKGVWLERGGKPHQYSMLRFADQHPLLTNSGFLSIARLKTPFVTVAPLVGSLEIDQNVVSLRQFELGVRGGTITGQCAFDWQGRRSTLELHVRASGVQSSHGEPFDGNISVIVSAADRTVEGRAEILRIGERHLLDLLDLQDPQHVDPGMNRIRTALKFGYPDKLRLVFDHGFASAHLELGGLARLVSIGELRGIPMGPLVDKMVAPLLEQSDTKEAP